MKITYRAAASQDGFIARADGDVTWLERIDVSSKASGIEDFFAEIGGLVMGRKTYDFVFDFGTWPYEDKPTWVCTRHELTALDGANLTVARSIDDVINDAKSFGIEHLWLLGGGRLASAFLDRGLLTTLSISEMPIKLGAGIPLFAGHTLEQIHDGERNVIEHANFRQIEISLRA